MPCECAGHFGCCQRWVDSGYFGLGDEKISEGLLGAERGGVKVSAMVREGGR